MVDRSMALNASRRQVLAAAVAVGGGIASRISVLAAPEASPKQTQIESDQKVSFSFALLNEHWDAIQETVESYAQQRGIEIDAKPLTYEELYSQLSLALTQQAPTFDVVSLEDPWIPQFATFLNPLEAPSDVMDSFVPVTAALGSYPEDTQLCALPWLGDVQFFALRPEWLALQEQRTPATWDETVETASVLADTIEPDSELYPFAISTLTGPGLVHSFLPILRGYGKSIIDAETSIPQLDTLEALGAMETFLSMATLSPTESGATGEPTNAEKFETGQVAMMADIWSHNLLGARMVEQKAPSGAITGNLQPAQPAAPRQTMTGVWLMGIPVGSLMADEAWLFLKWMTDRVAQSAMAPVGLPPVRDDVYHDQAQVAASPDLPTLFELLNAASPRPRSPFYPQLEQLLAKELKNALSGEKSGAAALKDANVAIREFLVREGVLLV